MMGPWAISGALLLGARLVLFEGAPDYPDAGRVWRLVERHRITHLGISPTLIRALLVHGDEPALAADRSSLRVLGSTGEPWNPDPWWWLFRVAGDGRVPIVNYTGGTEISGGILGASGLRPIRPTSFNGPCLGMAADVRRPDGSTVVDDGRRARDPAPWPGMTRGFWGGTPADRERYLDTYWRRVPGHLGPRRLGRPRRRRASGTSTAARTTRSRSRASASGRRSSRRWRSRTRRWSRRRRSACRTRSRARCRWCWSSAGATRRVEPEVLAREVAAAIVADMGKPVRPTAVVRVPDLPRTRSGKIMRRVARAAWLGLDPGDLSALENPAAVAAIGEAARARG